jgi:very-short-patch-repair endonuclease
MSRRQKEFFLELPNGKKFVSDVPQLVAEWHPTKNKGQSPDDVSYGSGKKLWWLCSKGHEWQSTVSNRSQGKGCPYCSGNFASPENNFEACYPELLAHWDHSKNTKQPSEYTKHSNQTVWWRCSKGHEWAAKISHRTQDTGCPACWNERRPEAVRPKASQNLNLLTDNPTLCGEWDYEKNKYPPSHYLPKSGARVHWRCPMGDDHRWLARIGSRSAPEDGVLNGCPFCAGHKPSRKYNFEIIHPNIAKEWDYERNAMLPCDYTPSSNHRAWWKCEKGHAWKATINNRTSGRNCPHCSNKSSRNEIRILTELKALFTNVKSRHKLEKHEADIYLPDLNIAIEYDGAWWHRDRLDKDQIKQDSFRQIGVRLLRVREYPLPSITDEDVFVDGSKAISKDDIGKLVKLISESAFNRYLIGTDFFNETAYRTYLDYFPDPFPENSLAKQNPVLARQWHPTYNEPLSPANFTRAASYRAWWRCEEGHEWEATINNRAKRGCPFCSGRYASEETSMASTHPKIAKFFHPTKNELLTVDNLKAGTSKLLWWRCDKGHEWQQTGYAVSKKLSNPCPACSAPIGMAESRPEMASAFHPTLNGELSPEKLTDGTGKLLWWQCSNDGSHIWQATGSNLKKSSRPNLCPKCRGKKR